jgi:hypothetical protein
VKIIILDKDGNSVKGYENGFKKSTFDNHFTLQRKAGVKAEKNNGNKIYCTCNGKIEITIANVNEDYYLKNLPRRGGLHDINCPMHSKYIVVNKYNESWSMDEETNKYVIEMVSATFGKKTTSGTASLPGTDTRNRTKVINGKPTLRGVAQKINTMAWEDYVRKNQRVPASIYEFSKQMFGTANKIMLKRKGTLNDLWYSDEKFNKLQTKDILFAVFPIQKIYPTPNSLNEKFMLYNTYTKKCFYISCNSEKVKEALISSKLTREKIEKDEDGYTVLAFGFVSKKVFKNKEYAEFLSIAFLPIIPEGLWCESSYERQIYSKLVKEERVFTKGYDPINDYNNYVPDIIFKDCGQVYYGEIFGIRNIEEYDEHKKEKIELAGASEDYRLWYWDIAAGEELPAFPGKH